VARLMDDCVLRAQLRVGGLVAGKRYGVPAHAAAVESVYRAVSA
jgi:hypothetical protein